MGNISDNNNALKTILFHYILVFGLETGHVTVHCKLGM